MHVEVDSRMQSSIMIIYCLTISMVVVQHPVIMYGVLEWKAHLQFLLNQHSFVQ